MKSKRFVVGLLTLFTVSAALAQTPGDSASTAALWQGGVDRTMHVAPDVTTVVSTADWAGYAVTGTHFTYAKGSWQVPELGCTKTPNSSASVWVGLDGYSDATMEQIGITLDCINATAFYSAFYNFYPGGSGTISTITVAPGDIISASVTYAKSEFTLSMDNHTTGQTFKTSMAVQGAKRSSAEWIAAGDPCDPSTPLTDFGVLNLGYDYTSVAGTNNATDSTVTNSPIATFPSILKLKMVCGAVKWALPSVLSADGTSFEITWK